MPLIMNKTSDKLLPVDHLIKWNYWNYSKSHFTFVDAACYKFSNILIIHKYLETTHFVQ